jgi:hypothetical protein
VRRLGLLDAVCIVDLVDIVGELAFLESVARPTRLEIDVDHLDHATSGHADRLDALHG